MIELLGIKDDRISELESELEKIREEEEREHWRWALPREIKNGEKLPVPRLEIRCVQDDPPSWCNFRWQYALIYKHLLGHFVAIPLGETRTSSSGNRPPIREERIDTPFREGVHICNDSETLKLPAFALCNGRIVRVSMKDGKCHQEAFQGAKS